MVSKRSIFKQNDLLTVVMSEKRRGGGEESRATLVLFGEGAAASESVSIKYLGSLKCNNNNSK